MKLVHGNIIEIDGKSYLVESIASACLTNDSRIKSHAQKFLLTFLPKLESIEVNVEVLK